MSTEMTRETPSAPLRPIRTASLLEHLHQLQDAEDARAAPDNRWAPVTLAAATLVQFTPSTFLASFGIVNDDASAEWLREHAESVPHFAQAVPRQEPDDEDEWSSEEQPAPRSAVSWRLTFAERRRALRAAPHVEGIRNARRKVAAVDSAEQRIADALLFGTLDIGSLSVGELAAAIEMRTWYDGVFHGLPEEAHLYARLALARLLEPMRRLVGQHFVGRSNELGRLTDYVGVLGPQKVAGLEAFGLGLRALRQVRRSLFDNPPLYVCGPGGVGKSSLVARFILNHVGTPQRGELPFVLLDFDRAQIESRMPLSLLVGALQQLRVQFPEQDAPMRRMAQSLMQIMRDSDAAELSGSDGLQASLVRNFAQQVDQMLGGKDDSTPLLWVLDTFEEPQRLGESVVGALWELMNTLQQSLPRLRLVVCGRVVPRGFNWDTVELDDFDDLSAKSYLHWRLSDVKPDYPVDDDSLGKLIKVVGRTPLALRLAVRLVASEDQGLLNLRLRRERIQAVLFHRVLEHIRVDEGRPLGTQWIGAVERRQLEDELVRLVYPGLAVRRITPGVIEHVLAELCGVTLRDEGHAGRLFAALAQQVDIVEPGDRDDDGEPSLLHITEVRRMMLRDLEQKAGEELIRRIDRRAVRYHVGFATLAHCAEEIYHRLRLQQSDATIRARWEEGLDRYLLPALEEIAAPATREMLADLLGVTLDAETLEGARQDAWERQAARRAGDYLRAGNPERALQVLDERSERVQASPLLRLEAQAWLQLGEFQPAAKRAEQALAEAAEAGEQAAAAEAALLLAQADEALGKFNRSHERVREALDWSEQLGDNYLVLRARTGLLRLARKSEDLSVELEVQKAQVKALLDVETLRGLRTRPALLRESLAELAASHARLLRVGLDVLGVNLPSQGAASDLADTLATWCADKAASGDSAHEVVTSFGLKGSSRGPSADQWMKWLWNAAPKDIGALLARLLKEAPQPEPVYRALADHFRREFDRRLARSGRQRAV